MLETSNGLGRGLEGQTTQLAAYFPQLATGMLECINDTWPQAHLFSLETARGSSATTKTLNDNSDLFKSKHGKTAEPFNKTDKAVQDTDALTVWKLDVQSTRFLSTNL